MYNKCNQCLGGWRVSLPGILGGFETRQKQTFHIFGTREKIKKKKFPGKIGIFRKISVFYREISVFIGKIGDF